MPWIILVHKIQYSILVPLEEKIQVFERDMIERGSDEWEGGNVWMNFDLHYNGMNLR